MNNSANLYVPILRAVGILTRFTVCILLIAVCSVRTHATLLAYEGFDYPAGTDLSGQNGGTGWSGPWATTTGDSNILGSLTYTDSLGNVLTVSGNSAYISAAVAAANFSTRRTNSFTRGFDTTNSTTWISFLSRRDGNDIQRAGSLQIHTNNNERLAIGKGTTNVPPPGTWSMLYNGSAGNSAFSTNPCNVVSFLVLRLDHLATANDNAYLFVNPLLNAEPSISQCSTQFIGNTRMGFNSIRLFAGYSGTGPSYAEMAFDEIRIGETYADVTPNTSGSPNVPSKWLSAILSGNSMSLTLTGAVNGSYVVQATTNPSDTNSWSSLGGLSLDGGGLGTFVDTNIVATNALRFYRAKKP